MSRCAYCHNPAVAIITGRGRGDYPYRSTTTCPTHQQQAHTWAARAGPPTVTPLGPTPDSTTAVPAVTVVTLF